MPGRSVRVIRRRALEIRQDPKHPLYLFSLTGEELLQLSEISRISRSKSGKLLGYQRPEVRQHVRNIVDYLDQKEVLFPNSIILALPSTTVFKKTRGTKIGGTCSEAGTLEIRIPRGDKHKRCASSLSCRPNVRGRDRRNAAFRRASGHIARASRRSRLTEQTG